MRHQNPRGRSGAARAASLSRIPGAARCHSNSGLHLHRQNDAAGVNPEGGRALNISSALLVGLEGAAGRGDAALQVPALAGLGSCIVASDGAAPLALSEGEYKGAFPTEGHPQGLPDAVGVAGLSIACPVFPVPWVLSWSCPLRGTTQETHIAVALYGDIRCGDEAA